MAARRRRLAERRKALGYSQESLAEQLGTDRTTVGRWERGETDPYPYIRLKLCQVLQVTTDVLDDLLTLDHERLCNALHPAQAITGRVVADPEPTGALDDMYRRELLQLLSIAGALVAFPETVDAAEPSWITETQESGELHKYGQLNAHLWQAFGLSKTKQLIYPLVHDQLGVLIERMDRTRSPAAHRELCVLACDLFQLAGEIFFDGDRYTDAAHCYSLAAAAGREARSHDRWACALTRQAFVSIYDKQYTRATTTLTAASTIARHGDSQLSTRHWVAAVQAQAFASLGDLDACNRALDTANQVLDRTSPVNPGGWLRFDGTRLAEERGTCYLSLGQTDLAETALTEALDSALSLRRRGSLLTDLAVLGAQRHDLHQLLHYAGDALDLAEQTQSSGYVGRKLQILQTQLTPLLTDRRVAQLNDQINHLSTAT